MRAAILTVALGLAVPISATAGSASPPVQRTVPCGEIIDNTRFPYVGDRRPQYRYRLVLNSVSVPPAYMAQVVPTHEQPWRYWRKAGVVVGANGVSVTVGVPKAWLERAAIVWGNAGGPFSSLRIAGCGSDPQAGNAYAGGFYLRTRSACVPLTFRVGRRTATVRFGVGQRCASG